MRGGRVHARRRVAAAATPAPRRHQSPAAAPGRLCRYARSSSACMAMETVADTGMVRRVGGWRVGGPTTTAAAAARCRSLPAPAPLPAPGSAAVLLLSVCVACVGAAVAAGGGGLGQYSGGRRERMGSWRRRTGLGRIAGADSQQEWRKRAGAASLYSLFLCTSRCSCTRRSRCASCRWSRGAAAAAAPRPYVPA